MIGKLKFLEEKQEWIIDYDIENNLVREIILHPQEKDQIEQAFDKAKSYYVEFTLCYIVELRLYCGRISKSSYPTSEFPILQEGVTRFEVIDDENGRVYGKWNVSVELSYQDDNKTLKAFIKKL